MFWCCCGDTPTPGPIDPIPGSVLTNIGFGARITTSGVWNDTNFPAFSGSYAYNQPLSSFFPNGTLNQLAFQAAQRSVVLGRKSGVWNPASLELNTNLVNFDLYYYSYVTQRFNVSQGTAITSAQLVMEKAPQIAEPPNAITAFVRVALAPQTLTFTNYPWLPSQYGVNATINGTYSAPVAFTIQPGVTTVDITAGVQSVINNAGWTTVNANYITLLIYTNYPQANLWVNNIHPGGNYPNYPASNTAVWFSDPGTQSTEPTIGAKVRIVL